MSDGIYALGFLFYLVAFNWVFKNILKDDIMSTYTLSTMEFKSK